MKTIDVPKLDQLLSAFRPLVTVSEATFLLGDCSPGKIYLMVESGRLRGVDISRSMDSERRELRIYRYTIDHYHYASSLVPEQVPVAEEGGGDATCPRHDWALIPVENILPHGRNFLRVDEVAHLLNCTSRHVVNLKLPALRLSGAEAREANSTYLRRYTRDGLVAFLKEREIGMTA